MHVFLVIYSGFLKKNFLYKKSSDPNKKTAVPTVSIADYISYFLGMSQKRLSCESTLKFMIFPRTFLFFFFLQSFKILSPVTVALWRKIASIFHIIAVAKQKNIFFSLNAFLQLRPDSPLSALANYLCLGINNRIFLGYFLIFKIGTLVHIVFYEMSCAWDSFTSRRWDVFIIVDETM